jgi:TolA-binding protein
VVAAVAIVLVGIGIDRHEARALSFAVAGGHVARDGIIEADPGVAASLHFSDGSDVAFAPGAHVALRRVDGQGASLALTAGTAYVDIAHRPLARWSFEAGPFVIAVTGTAFRLGWNATQEELEVRMDRGSVEVRGPLSDGPIALRSGQHLFVRVRQRETVIRDNDETAPLEIPPEGAMPSAQHVDAPPPSIAASGAVPPTVRARTHSASDVDWQGLLAGGDFETIIRQAQRRGLEESMAGVASSDLAALADAARYSRHDDIARRALVVQRHRFPGSPAARDAAFLLGRLEETVRNSSAAVDWYARYMQEDPNGTYASEALGRKMILVQQISGATEARAAAAEYLSHFPDGPYRARAQALTRAP